MKAFLVGKRTLLRRRLRLRLRFLPPCGLHDGFLVGKRALRRQRQRFLLGALARQRCRLRFGFRLPSCRHFGERARFGVAPRIHLRARKCLCLRTRAGAHQRLLLRVHARQHCRLRLRLRFFPLRSLHNGFLVGNCALLRRCLCLRFRCCAFLRRRLRAPLCVGASRSQCRQFAFGFEPRCSLRRRLKFERLARLVFRDQKMLGISRARSAPWRGRDSGVGVAALVACTARL